ncbi:MAG: protein kinase domain-containing protein [Myxococcota bacterium]
MHEAVCPDCLRIVHPEDEDCTGCGRTRPEEGWRPDALVGLIIDERYQLQRRLGEGGMGTVYRARRVGRLGGEVAVKVLPPVLARTVAARRFEREAQVVSRLSNPHIVRVYDFDGFRHPSTGDPLYYLAMELVRGNPLSVIMRATPRPNFLWTIDVLRQTARGLDEAHREGIVHRDLKPSNLMILQQHGSTHVKILDFGIAALVTSERDEGEGLEKLTRTGYITGTPDYMAPEQAMGRSEVGPTADMYALGVIAYRLLTGEMPFHGDTAMEVLTKRVGGDAPSLREACPPPSLPSGMYPIVDRLLQRDPAKRYANAGDLLRDLAAFPTIQAAPDVEPDPTLIERYEELTPHSVATDVPADRDAATDGDRSGSQAVPGDMETAAEERGVSGGLVPAMVAVAVLLLAGGAVGLWLVLGESDDVESPGEEPTTVAAGGEDGQAPADEQPAAGGADEQREQATAGGDEGERAPDEAPSGPGEEEPQGEEEHAAVPDGPRSLDGPRPDLEDGFEEALRFERDGVAVSVAAPAERPGVREALPLLVTVDRGDEALRAAGAEVTLAEAPDAPPIRARGRDEDGRVALEVPGAEDPAPRHLTLTVVLHDGSWEATRLVWDPATGLLMR